MRLAFAKKITRVICSDLSWSSMRFSRPRLLVARPPAPALSVLAPRPCPPPPPVPASPPPAPELRARDAAARRRCCVGCVARLVDSFLNNLS